jgi:hypothetical protein
MTSARPRYAIYFVPPAGSALYRWGSRLLGYDCYRGVELAPPAVAGLPRDWRELTEAPRRYGFHGTLKAPFHLKEGRTEAELIDAFLRFAGEWREPAAIGLVVRTLSDFIALVPIERNFALARLAEKCVQVFDDYRGPLLESDRLRQLGNGLMDRQRVNLDRWGYPYVFEDFRFHMTLTGPLEDARRAPLRALLARLHTHENDSELVQIDRITVVRQDSRAAGFTVIRQAVLAAATTHS